MVYCSGGQHIIYENMPIMTLTADSTNGTTEGEQLLSSGKKT
jgi:hypothetical protein